MASALARTSSGSEQKVCGGVNGASVSATAAAAAAASDRCRSRSSRRRRCRLSASTRALLLST
eukprot:ctg_1127.g224